ncbi:hypothetical protein BDV12DRAFT_194131 [Aspergillus spectabilis]
MTPTYPNGNNGEDPNDEKNNGDRSNYGLANSSDCTDFTRTDDANTQLGTTGAQRMESEHIIEEQTQMRDGHFYQNPQMDLANGNGVVSSGLETIPFDVSETTAIQTIEIGHSFIICRRLLSSTCCQHRDLGFRGTQMLWAQTRIPGSWSTWTVFSMDTKLEPTTPGRTQQRRVLGLPSP